MKKDKKWAQKEVDRYLSYEGVNEARNALVFAKGVINQLDEPEVSSQIDKLANFIMSEVEGEPSQNQGAVDTAIRIIKSYQNQETLSEEWPGGYEAEEEQKYYVVSRGNRMMLVRMMGGETVTEAVPYELENVDECVRKSYQLTEQEIKDYDERFWPFAVPVEELEE